jgi:hypothetical protein
VIFGLETKSAGIYRIPFKFWAKYAIEAIPNQYVSHTKLLPSGKSAAIEQSIEAVRKYISIRSVY